MSTTLINPVSQAAPARDALRGPAGFLFSPGEYFASVAARPTWIWPLLTACAMTLAATWLMLPYTIAALRATVPSQSAQALERQIQIARISGLAMAPAIVLVKIVIGAALMLILAQMVTARGDFRGTFSLASHLAVIGSLPALHTLAVLSLRGMDSIRGPLDLGVAVGINTLIHGASPAVDALLNSINIYDLWALCLMAIGVRAMFRTSRSAAAWVAFIYWALTTAVAAALAVLGQAFRPVA